MIKQRTFTGYSFPEIIKDDVASKSPDEALIKIFEELGEVVQDYKRHKNYLKSDYDGLVKLHSHCLQMELIDLIHAIETFQRTLGLTESDILDYKKRVFDKNNEREYYGS